MRNAAVIESNSEIPSPRTEITSVRDLRLIPLPHKYAKELFERHHYLHSMPGGTELCFGVTVNGKLEGAVSFGAGPANAYRLVRGASLRDCLALTRLWLSDELPRNSESRVIAMTLRVLKRETNVKFVVTYADPAHGHTGIIYQACGWLYSGVSEATPLLDLGDGIARHSRSVSHSLGTQNTGFLKENGFDVIRVRQQRKHRYVFLFDSNLRDQLTSPVLPYPKPNPKPEEERHADHRHLAQ